MKRIAVYFPAPRQVAWREDALPPVGPDQVLVQTIVSAVSPGTELLVLRGEAPVELTVDETIAALAGSFSFPVKYGYAAVGRVVEMGTGVESQWRDRLVFAFNPHETYFISTVDDLHPVPPDVAPETAVLLPTMETAVSFLMDGQPSIGEKVAVFGQGIVGLLTTALLASYPIGGLLTLDAYALRREWSRRLGAQITLDAHDPQVVEKAKAVLAGAPEYTGADLCYELSGNPSALDTAIALTGYHGRIVIGSWYGQKRASLDLGGRFHRAHMQIVGSQVSTLAPRWRGRWTKERRLGVTWEMLRRHAPERLITHRLPFSRAAEGYQLLESNPEQTIQLVFTYGQ